METFASRYTNWVDCVGDNDKWHIRELTLTMTRWMPEKFGL